MLVLLAIGLAAGVITSVSPCVLPVLPVVLAGGATGSGRRPFAIVAGLVASFTLFTLTATAILDALGLPQDLLRNVAIALLFVVAATMFFPRLGLLLERPLAFMTRRRGGDLGGGFVLGVSLGLVFVPCAGPVLATITVLSAQQRFSLDSVLLTLAYALGAALPLLLITLGGQRVAQRLRAGGENLRRAMGVVVALSAVAIVFDAETRVQTALGGYSSSLQKHVEDTSVAKRKLHELRGGGNAFAAASKPTSASSKLPDYGPGRDFTGISHWLNTPGERPLTLQGLRGKVVLVDFWTYSCINCIRTLPHLRAWYAAYHKDGLEIVGVHTPEFAFEHVLSNVRSAARRLKVTWPVALDNDYGTWNAYSNEYWPAEYLIDRTGRVRRIHFGEGEYGETERAIRVLLAQGGVHVPRRTATVADATPTEATTPETYLGYVRLERYAGSPIRENRAARYELPATLSQSELAYGGEWRIGGERAVAVADASLRLRFVARDVYVVLGGKGRVHVLVDGKPARSIGVTADQLYTVFSSPTRRDALLELRFSPGVNAYSFTFG
jgi:cytochrome c biogenesis protein CcdA/thiol-disulfide isomerase/thioredoxin